MNQASKRCTRMTVGLTSILIAPTLWAQAFVEYPGHNATYGSHTIANATWVGGPTGVTVSLESDGTLHADGMGFSQRTARNTLNHTSPSSPDNPQNYDNLELIDRYSARLPLLQQLSAGGISTLVYQFDEGVNDVLDLFIADVDQSDAASVAAFDHDNNPVDMTTWHLADEGDLSLYKNTGVNFSTIIAPTPLTEITPGAITLVTDDSTNYNRSFSILRSPVDQNIGRIEITFEGIFNSPSRENGGNGSHIYTGLTVAPVSPGDANADGRVDLLDLDILGQNWQQPFTGAEFGDFNQDGNVDLLDLDILGANWQGSSATFDQALASSSISVPEPFGLSLVAVGSLAMGWRRKF